MTYLFFMKMLDDAPRTTEANTNAFGIKVKDPVFKEGEEGRTRKEQSFFVPVEEIRNNDYDLSINKYKEIEKVKLEYEAPDRR